VVMPKIENLHATVADKPILKFESLIGMSKYVAVGWAAILLFNATPAAAQLDAEGTGLMNQVSECVQKYAFEKDDGIKSPETIADETIAACKDKSVALEEYAVRHSVKMTDQLRNQLRGEDRKQAIGSVLLNRQAGRVHAPNR
jgi:hypothetical protein